MVQFFNIINIWKVFTMLFQFPMMVVLASVLDNV